VEFVLEQGYAQHDAGLYQGLMFQPRVVGVVVAAGLLSQSAWLFAALGAVLWCGAIAPALNPFDVFYNLGVAGPRGRARIHSTTAPRRFAGGVAGTVALAIAALTGFGPAVVAWALQFLFAAANAAVLLARFCPPAVMYKRLSASKRRDARTLRDPLART
jgi:hypothetical protein